jgi:membrane protein
MLLSFLFSAAIAVAGSYLHDNLPRLDGAWELANSGVSMLVTAMLFGLIYRVIPDARISWRDVIPGAAIAALLFVLGKYVLGFYFGRSAVASSYGPASSVIIVLVWVYYSAQIMLFGAEFSRVYGQRFGSHREDETHVGIGSQDR